MKKILLTVAALLLVVTASNAVQNTRRGGLHGTPAVHHTKKHTTKKAQGSHPVRLPNKAALPQRFDVIPSSFSSAPGVGAVATLPPVVDPNLVGLIQGAPVTIFPFGF
jgi:hypothetical protein